MRAFPATGVKKRRQPVSPYYYYYDYDYDYRYCVRSACRVRTTLPTPVPYAFRIRLLPTVSFSRATAPSVVHVHVCTAALFFSSSLPTHTRSLVQRRGRLRFFVVVNHARVGRAPVFAERTRTHARHGHRRGRRRQDYGRDNARQRFATVLDGSRWDIRSCRSCRSSTSFAPR